MGSRGGETEALALDGRQVGPELQVVRKWVRRYESEMAGLEVWCGCGFSRAAAGAKQGLARWKVSDTHEYFGWVGKRKRKKKKRKEEKAVARTYLHPPSSTPTHTRYAGDVPTS